MSLAVVPDLLPRLLARVMDRHGVEQAFLFSGGGEQFHAGRHPVLEAELELLQSAFDLIDSVDQKRSKPYVAHDAKRRFSVSAAAEPTNLYLVCLNLGPDREAAEERLAAMQQDIVRDLAASARLPRH